MAKETTKRAEEKRDPLEALDKRVTQLEAIVRMLKKKLQEQFGMEGRGTIALSVFVCAALLCLVSLVSWLMADAPSTAISAFNDSHYAEQNRYVVPTVTVYSVVMPVTSLTSISNGDSITVSGSYLKLSADEVATCTLANASSDGFLAYLKNVSGNSIVFEDTAHQMLAGDVTLGSNDTLVIISDGTNWTQFGTSDN